MTDVQKKNSIAKPGVRPLRLSEIANLIQASRYLEVGVFKGDTFFNVPVPFKVAVDPSFAFDIAEFQDENTRFHATPSDEFWAKAEYEPFDLIYLDGLHTFEQTLRDFLASFKFAHSSTIWLIDDTVPTDKFAMLRDQDACRYARRAIGSLDTRWMGDTFKVIYFIQNFMPQFTYATFVGHGQTAVWHSRRHNFLPRQSDILEIAGITYERFVEDKFEMMNMVEDSQLLNLIKLSR